MNKTVITAGNEQKSDHSWKCEPARLISIKRAPPLGISPPLKKERNPDFSVLVE